MSGNGPQDGSHHVNNHNQLNNNPNILPGQHERSMQYGMNRESYTPQNHTRGMMSPSPVHQTQYSHRGYPSDMSMMHSPRNMTYPDWGGNDQNQLRNQMIRSIIDLLKAKKPNANEEWIQKLPEMARKLEDKLFHQSTSKEEYTNQETLTARLQRIALQITQERKRRQQQAQQQQQQQQQQNQRLRREPGSAAPLPGPMMYNDRRASHHSMTMRPMNGNQTHMYPSHQPIHSTSYNNVHRPPPAVQTHGAPAPIPPHTPKYHHPGARTPSNANPMQSQASLGQDGNDRNKAIVLKQQQHRLLLLRHASRCTYTSNCPATRHCENYKRLWIHIANCRDQQCKTPHCVSSRYVLAHYHRCQEANCAVCRPVRDAISKQNQAKMQQNSSINPYPSRRQPQLPARANSNGRQFPPRQQSHGMPPPPRSMPTPRSVGSSTPRAAPQNEFMPSPAPATPAAAGSHKSDIEKRMAELEQRRKALAEKKRKEAEEEEAIQREMNHLQKLKSTGTVATPPLNRSTSASFRQQQFPVRSPYMHHQPDFQRRMSGPDLPLTQPPKRQAISSGSSRPIPKAPMQQNGVNAVEARRQRLIESLKSMQNQSSLVYTFNIQEIGEHVKSLTYKCASSTAPHLKSTELKQKAIGLLKSLLEEEFAWIFNKPVDPIQLDIPDYFDVIRHPMDLGTVKKQVESNYYKSLKEFANDVRLVFNNAMLYNPETGDVHSIARQYGFKFEKQYNTLLRDMKREESQKRKNESACRLCGGEKYTFEPPVYYCSGKCNQKVRRGAFFYITPDNKQFYCLTCYNSWLKDEIMLEDGTVLTKAKLKKKKNDEVQEEAWVECNMCKKWYHQICVLFNSRRNDQSRNEPFYCPVCVLRYIEQLRADRLPQPKDVKFSAADLPRSGYSDFLELRVKRRILEARKNFARSRRMRLSQVDESPEVSIRVVSCRDVDLIPRAGLERLYGVSHKYPKSFNHKVKCVLLFQKVDGVDVLILGLYTQVYGSQAAAPNTRSLYIAYLDSVNYFSPSFCRTPVYKEMLQSTLEFEKKRGITKTFIWVCPPLAGDDYILYCHPKDQKTPKADMLRNWYFALLEDSRKKGVVVSIDNLYDAYFQRMCCITSVPNFDGDYWPGVTEQFIEQLDSEKIDPKSITPRKKRTFSRNKHVEKSAKNKKSKGKKQSKSKKKNKSKSKSKSKTPVVEIVLPEEDEDVEDKTAESDDIKPLTAESFIPPRPLNCLEVPQQDALTVKIAEVIHQMKDDFMVVYMHHICSACCVDIDKPNQTFWLPEKYDFTAIDLDYAKNRYAPPYALCDDCFKEKWSQEFPDTEISYANVQIEKTSLQEADLLNVKGFGTSNDAIKALLTELVQKVERNALAELNDDDDDDDSAELFEEDTTQDADAGDAEKEPSLENTSVDTDKMVTEKTKTNISQGLTIDTALDKPSTTLSSPKSTVSQTQPEEVITVLPEGVNASRRSAWVTPPCGLKDMVPFKTNIAEETIDTDEIRESHFFDTRQQFLSLCQGNKYQFDQLRRAKHSSMMVLYHLHNPDLPSFVHSCNNCKADIAKGERFTCRTCDDYDLCENCAKRVQHHHPLHSATDPSKGRVVNPGLGIGGNPYNQRGIGQYSGQRMGNNYASVGNRPLKVQAHMALLVHASNCQNQSCSNKHCSRMRQLLKHGATCKTRVKGQCKICKRIWGLLHLHSRQCQVRGYCNVPGCNKLRAHLRRVAQSQDRRIRMQTQRMQQERQRAAEQRMAPLHTTPMSRNVQPAFGINSPSLSVQRNAKQGKHLRS